MNCSFLYDDDGVYIGPESDYNEFGIDTRTCEPFYNSGFDRDINNAINTAKAEAKAEGKAEGRVEANLDNARKMKADGLTVEQIAKYTSLSIDEIKAL